MAVAIRLSRGGAKKRPYYKIVVTDARNSRDGKFIERIGSYNPLLPKDSAERVKLDVDRVKHWLSVGAKPSDRVLRFLDAAGIQERAPRNNPNKAVPGDKAKERAEERVTRDAAAAEAAAQAAAAPAEEPVEEAAAEPVEEAAVAEEPVAEAAAAEEAAPEEAPAEEAAAPEEAPAELEAVAEETAAPAAEATPADEALNQGESSADPVEGSDADTPAEGAEKAE